jgi:hypothetical protein
MKLILETRVRMTQELQLICNCCGQPYHAAKCWKDQLDAVMQGQEKFAICPVCTQAPPPRVFETAGYRRRCLYEVKRLQKLWAEDRAKVR